MIVRVDEGLWSVEHDLFLPGGVHFRGRMTIVRLQEGLLLHSPVPIDANLAGELAAIGPVAHIVAPSRLHYLHLAGVAELYPDAVTWGAPGLAEKRPDLPLQRVLSSEVPWASELEPLFIEGIPWMNELVFFHRASRTLIVTDLFFNIHEVANLRTKLFFSLYGILGRPKQSPVVWLATRDRPAAATSARQLLAWDFQRAIPAHGEIIEDDAHAVVTAVLARQLRHAPALPQSQ